MKIKRKRADARIVDISSISQRAVVLEGSQ
jgi:hypothetical protein